MNYSCIYHIYPLGMFGAPRVREENSLTVNRISELIDWIPYLSDLGVDAVLLGPVSAAMTHGYDTRDLRLIDPRLGSREDMIEAADALRAAGIDLILDGVFNHAGRDFFAYQELLNGGGSSEYEDWFKTSIQADGSLGAACWEGHEELIEMNLGCDAVREYIFSAVGRWISDLDIAGIRLDVAYALDEGFIEALRDFCDARKPEFFLLGEMIHGDYNRLLGPARLDSVTNYVCYKGLYSSHNDRNYYEIAYELNRQFGEEGVYSGSPLYNFVDNHDVNRLSSMLTDPKHLQLVYTLLFMMPGIPSIYYGSERAVKGTRDSFSDHALRPRLFLHDHRDEQLFRHIKELIRIRKEHEFLFSGRYRQLALDNTYLAFSRASGEQEILVLLNLDEQEVHITLEGVAHDGFYEDLLIVGQDTYIENEVTYIEIPAHTARIFRYRS